MAIRVFISHASKDSDFAERLAGDLRRAGADVWLDATHIGQGNFVQRINEAINARDVLILVLTPDALTSRWVPDEMDAALVRYKQGFMQAPIVVLAKSVPLRDIPALWTTYNRIDASSRYDAALPYIARALGLTPAKVEPSAPPPSPQPVPVPVPVAPRVSSSGADAGATRPASDAPRTAPIVDPSTSVGPSSAEQASAQPEPPVSDQAVVSKSRLTRRQLLIGAGIAVVGAAGIGGGVWFSNAESSGIFRQKWRYQPGGQASAPIVSNGMLYFTSNDSNVYALDIHTGARRWIYQTGGFSINGDDASRPAVASGMVYVGASDGLYALDASAGTKRWQFPSDHYVSAPVVVNGVVYANSDDDHVYALDASTGAKLWGFPTGSAPETVPAVANGMVYAADAAYNLFALHATTGKVQWDFQTGNHVSYSPTVANGTVYFASFDQNVYALNANTGKVIWKDSGAGFEYSTPTVANGIVYIGSNDQYLYALDAQTGHKIWSYRTALGVSWPTVANGVVYAGSDDGNLYVFDASTGAMRWSFHTEGTGMVTPAVNAGVVYFTSGDSAFGQTPCVYAISAD